MAKGKSNEETTEQTPPVIPDSSITIEETGEIVSVNDMIETLKNMQPGMEVTSVYYEFPMGQPVKCFYVGDTKIKGQKGEDVPAVRILFEDGTFGITASAVVVSTFKQYPKLKGFSVTRVGEQKGPNGTYYTYKIFELVL